jgi:hypothetical protein
MKIIETWALVEEKSRTGNSRSAIKTAFASGVRAVAVEMLMHSRDVLNADDGAALYARFMATADRIER